MRQLDTSELLSKFDDYSRDIRFTEFKNLNIKLDQFFNFLNEQEISKRILNRIEEDFSELNKVVQTDKFQRSPKFIRETVEKLSTREIQGAFAYFTLKQKFEALPKYSNHYLELTREWYLPGGNYNDWQTVFNTYFFEPFQEIIEWYLKESEAISDLDYFSIDAQDEISNKIDEIESQIAKLGIGQEVVFNEIHDVKKLAKKLTKKNWKEIIKGKFLDLALEKIISVDFAKNVIEFLTGDIIKLLK